jgi:hypothetical protein
MNYLEGPNHNKSSKKSQSEDKPDLIKGAPMRNAFAFLISLFILQPIVFAGYTAVCESNGSVASIGESSDYANADFIYSSPCPPTGANPNAVCLSETEFNTAKSIPTKYLKCRRSSLGSS